MHPLGVNPEILFERVRKHMCYASNNKHLPLENALTPRSLSTRDQVCTLTHIVNDPGHVFHRKTLFMLLQE